MKITDRRTFKKSFVLPSNYISRKIQRNSQHLFVKESSGKISSIDSKKVLEIEKKHRYIFSCEKNESLSQSTSQLRAFLFREEIVNCDNKDLASVCDSNCQRDQDCLLINSISLENYPQIEEFEIFHKLDTFFLNDSSFFFEYHPVSVPDFLSNKTLLLIETEFFCSFLGENSQSSLELDLQKEINRNKNLEKKELLDSQKILQQKEKIESQQDTIHNLQVNAQNLKTKFDQIEMELKQLLKKK